MSQILQSGKQCGLGCTVVVMRSRHVMRLLHNPNHIEETASLGKAQDIGDISQLVSAKNADFSTSYPFLLHSRRTIQRRE